MQTALREIGNREVVFARAALLVEEETTRTFLSEITKIHGPDLHANGISMLPVDGEGGFKPFHKLLDGLGIPHVNLRDPSWGHNPRYPLDRFFSLANQGASSFEEYMDSQGFESLRKSCS